MHEISGRAEISRLRRAFEGRSVGADFNILEIAGRRVHHVRVAVPRVSRYAQRRRELVIVVG